MRWHRACFRIVSINAEIDNVMGWHVKVGNLPWCKTPYTNRQDLRIVAHDDKVAFMCSHTDIANAVRMVEWLRQYGIGRPRLVDGMCDEVDKASPDPVDCNKQL